MEYEQREKGMEEEGNLNNQLVQISRTFMQGFSLYHLVKKAYTVRDLLTAISYCKYCHMQESGEPRDKTFICRCND